MHICTCVMSQAKNLPNTDVLGKSDPYAICTVRGESKTSAVKANNLNPVFYHWYVCSLL